MKNKRYKISVLANAPLLYPTDSVYILMRCDADEIIEVPKAYPYSGEWGQCNSEYISIFDDNYPMPKILDMVYLSIVERVFYELEIELSTIELIKLWESQVGDACFSHIYIGMAPFGGVALWAHSTKKQILLNWAKGKEISIDMEDYLPMAPNLTLNEVCNHYINNDALVARNLKENGLPPRDLFDKYMRQYTYRYYPMFEKWNEDDEKWEIYDEEKDVVPQFEYIEEMLTDGTHDKLHDDGLLKYHEAGKPKKLAMKWWVKKSEYVAYFWFDDEVLCPIFEKFYGAHRDTKVDFRLRIDAQKKKYELSLFRQGLKEPQVLPEEAYQLLVFKSQFENYRSDNYNQERGAWIW